MKKNILIILALLAASFGTTQAIIKIDSLGNLLRQFYLKEDVEHNWLAGQHVDWETGKPDNPYTTKDTKTHCSSFAASVCKQKKLYLLCPPKHNVTLLANAQFDWLFTKDAASKGWLQIKKDIFKNAQSFANKGFVVVAVYKNPIPKKPGHIALVMPKEKSITALDEEGPNLIQAGQTNKSDIPLRQGFKNHIADWANVLNDIVFFYNEKSKQ